MTTESDMKEALAADAASLERGAAELERVLRENPREPADAGESRVLSVVGVSPEFVTIRAECDLAAAGGHVRFLAPLSYEQAEALEYELRKARLERRG